MRAAVRMAAKDLVARVGPDKPFWLVGYSNGAALSVEYALDGLEGAHQPAPSGLVLLSPAIGIAPAARIVRLRHLFGWVPGLNKLGWTEISAEYDPFKYSSFTFNAIEQTSELTNSIQSRTARLSRSGRLGGPGPVLGPPPAAARQGRRRGEPRRRRCPARQPGGGVPPVMALPLVLFDVNRGADASQMLRGDPGPLTKRLLSAQALPFELTIVGNAPGDPAAVDALVRSESGAQTRVPLCLSWPAGVFSLSHLALPFPADDRLYGYAAARDVRVVQLGRIEARGETGVLAVPRWLATRQRSNPFFPYLEQRVLAFTGSPRPEHPPCGPRTTGP